MIELIDWLVYVFFEFYDLFDTMKDEYRMVAFIFSCLIVTILITIACYVIILLLKFFYSSLRRFI